MRLLVTGATGFVGRELISLLSKQDFEINMTTRSPEKLAMGSNIHVFPGINLSEQTDWQPALTGCDIVVHLAARVHILNDSAANPLEEFRAVNTAGTINLAKQAAAAGVKRFIFVSSAHVLGNQSTNKLLDESAPYAPHTDYAISKMEAELELKALAAKTNMKLVIIRPPLVYGSEVAGNLQRLMWLLTTGIPLPFANAVNKRSMIASANLVDFISVCITHPNAANETFVVTDNQDISTAQLIRLLAKGMGIKPRLFAFPIFLLRTSCKLLKCKMLFNQLYGSLQLDATKSRELLQWQPPVEVERALFLTGQGYIKSR
ncbi:NAD-dependent epimerase/dehydratase family protein [Legionella dresdenensis]|uniref:NAD-dependent epimerase/dehydratase family protein n=1 Tax=Legionella dresdenensis TaxID=450200 RepID=A0ABV8CCX4_9GAMM